MIFTARPLSLTSLFRCVKPCRRHVTRTPFAFLPPAKCDFSGDMLVHIGRTSACALQLYPSQRRMLSRRAVVHRKVGEKNPIEVLLESPVTHELQEHDYFNVRNLVSIRDLFHARVHLGHTVGTLDTKMAHYLYGKRFEVSRWIACKLPIMHAETVPKRKPVCIYVLDRGGMVLFISRNRFQTHAIETMAQEAGEYSHCRYWQGGTISNAEMVFGSLTRLPDIIVFFTTLNSVLSTHLAVKEAAAMNIPTIAVLDSNCNPDMITYPIPGNDDSPSAVELYCRVFRETILRAKRFRQQVLKSAANETGTDGEINTISTTVIPAREVGSPSTNRYPVEPSGRAGNVLERHEQPPTDFYLDHADDDSGAESTPQNSHR